MYCWLVCMIFIIGMLYPIVETAKGVHRGRGLARTRVNTWTMPIKLSNNNPLSTDYYGHKDVSQFNY